MAEQTTERDRQHRAARTLACVSRRSGAFLAARPPCIAWLASQGARLEASTELTNVMQGVDAGVSLSSCSAAPHFYLSTLESRWRRDQALKALHEFRSIVHVIDMHQLTKDPSALGGPRTSSSPERDMTRYELVRYLELLLGAAVARQQGGGASTPRSSTIRSSSTPSATSSG